MIGDSKGMGIVVKENRMLLWNESLLPCILSGSIACVESLVTSDQKLQTIS